MIMPCDDARGCGTFTVQNSKLDDMTYTPIQELPYEHMTGYMPGNAAPVPGTTNVPTPSGVIASEGLNMNTPVTGIAAGMDFNNPAAPGSAANVTGGSSVNPPSVLPESPQIQVPTNPLLPPGFQEVIDYENLQYLNGFLRTQIGKYIRVQQLIGSSVIEDRYGYLVGVGINYILLQEIGTGNIIALDYYSIKYVYIYYTNPTLPTNGSR